METMCREIVIAPPFWRAIALSAQLRRPSLVGESEIVPIENNF